MHRAICRLVGRSCRKWRENEVPPIVGNEDVRRGGQQKREEKFIPDEQSRYTLCDAVGWTAGLVVAYELTHGRLRGLTTVDERPQSLFSRNAKCPFGIPWPRTVASQPILSQSIFEIESFGVGDRKVSVSSVGSIDATPFVEEEKENLFEIPRSPRNSILQTSSGTEDVVQFKSNENEEVFPVSVSPSSSSTSTASLQGRYSDSESEEDVVNFSRLERRTGDVMGILGAIKFVYNEAMGLTGPQAGHHVSDITPEEPPMSAIELLEQGVEMGSARSLYNIGVAYHRMKDTEIAKEYFAKAADLGHPLATYNTAIYLLRDGKTTEGMNLMREAAEGGVPEAINLLNKPRRA